MVNSVINLQAEEYIARDKNASWYVILAVVTAALAAIAAVTQQWSFLALVIVAAFALVIYSLRKPRIIHYSLTDKGISEGNKLHEFEKFKSFGVLIEDGHCSIVLTPKERFAPRETIYFQEAQGEEIVDAFGAKLKMEEVKLDVLDKIVRFLRI